MYLRVLTLCAALWVALIWQFSAEPASLSELTSGGITDRVADILWRAPSEAQRALLERLVRKAAHMTEFALLAMLLASLVTEQGRGRGCAARRSMACAAVLAALDEAHQLFVAGRSCQVSDVAIDCAGALAGLLLWYLLAGRREARRTLD